MPKTLNTFGKKSLRKKMKGSREATESRKGPAASGKGIQPATTQENEGSGKGQNHNSFVRLMFFNTIPVHVFTQILNFVPENRRISKRLPILLHIIH